MYCINCEDEYGFKRKCCGISEFTQAEKDLIVAQGFSEDNFIETNAGIFSKMRVVGEVIIVIEDEEVPHTISRCIFLDEDGHCIINQYKSFESCKCYPFTSAQNYDCGEGGYEGTGE